MVMVVSMVVALPTIEVIAVVVVTTTLIFAGMLFVTLRHSVAVGGPRGALAVVLVVVWVHAPRRRSAFRTTSRASSSWSGTSPTT